MFLKNSTVYLFENTLAIYYMNFIGVTIKNKHAHHLKVLHILL